MGDTTTEYMETTVGIKGPNYLCGGFGSSLAQLAAAEAMMDFNLMPFAGVVAMASVLTPFEAERAFSDQPDAFDVETGKSILLRLASDELHLRKVDVQHWALPVMRQAQQHIRSYDVSLSLQDQLMPLLVGKFLPGIDISKRSAELRLLLRNEVGVALALMFMQAADDASRPWLTSHYRLTVKAQLTVILASAVTKEGESASENDIIHGLIEKGLAGIEGSALPN